MPLKTVLLFLLEKLGHGRRTATFGYEEVQQWEKSVLPILLREKFLVESAELAKTFVACDNCEQRCNVLIHHNYAPGQDVIFCTELTEIEGIKSPDIAENYFHECWGVSRNLSRQWEIHIEFIEDFLVKKLPPLTQPPAALPKIDISPLGLLNVEGIKPCLLSLSIEQDIALTVNSKHTILLADLFHIDPNNSVIQLDGGLIEKYTERTRYTNAISTPTEERNTQIFKKYHEIKAQFPHLKTDNDVIPQMMKDKNLVGTLGSSSVRRILSDQKKLSK
jgi:hypothetical protein